MDWTPKRGPLTALWPQEMALVGSGCREPLTSLMKFMKRPPKRQALCRWHCRSSRSSAAPAVATDTMWTASYSKAARPSGGGAQGCLRVARALRVLSPPSPVSLYLPRQRHGVLERERLNLALMRGRAWGVFAALQTLTPSLCSSDPLCQALHPQASLLPGSPFQPPQLPAHLQLRVLHVRTLSTLYNHLFMCLHSHLGGGEGGETPV